MAGHGLWAHDGTYPPRQGNEVDILIDGEKAYGQIFDAFYKAKEFIYLTISYCDDDFLLVPKSDQTLFDILRSRRNAGVDVRMVVWEPALSTSRSQRKFFGQKSDSNMQFGCIAQKSMRYSG